MKALSEPNVTTYHYEYDANGNRTTVEIKDDGLTLESTVYTYDRLNKLVSSREVTASGLYLYEYTYDDNGNLVSEDRHRQFETQRTNIRRYEYTKDNKLESVYSGNTLLVSYTYDGDGTITSSLERDLDLNQNLNIHDTNYLNSLTNNQRQLINKVPSNDSFLYELTEYITDKNRPYSETLMERDGTGQLSTIYTYGNQRINSESYNNLSGLYAYDGRGSVSAVIGSYGDFRASYWYDGLGNVKSQIYGYGAFGSGKKYYGYNAEQYNPVTGSQNLRARQVNIRRQRFLTEDTYLGNKTNILSINRYIYGNDNPLKYKDPSGNFVGAVSISIEALIAIGIVISGFIATIQVNNTIKKHNITFDDIEIFPKSNIEHNPIIDIPATNIPKTNVDIYPRVELPTSDNVLTTPSEDVIGNKIVGDIFKAEENSAQISCAKDEVNHKNNIGEYLDKRQELTGSTREKLLQQARDAGLRKEINELYRDKAVIGDGGTADALRDEFEKGTSKHLQKAQERLNRINDIISNNKLSLEDLDLAEALRDDLESAINLFNNSW